jgi:MFS superfamily sulfate permease-like transporter
VNGFLSGKDDGYDKDAIKNKVVPKDVEVYEINGPFFFAIADKLKDTIASIEVDSEGIHTENETCSGN